MSQSFEKVSLIFISLLALLFVWTSIEALNFGEKARYFPLYVSILAVIFCLIELSMNIKRLISKQQEEETFHPNIWSAFKYIGWLALLLLFIYIVGFKFGTAAFLVSFLKVESKFKWWSTILSAGITVLFLYFFGDVYLNIEWPGNLLGL